LNKNSWLYPFQFSFAQLKKQTMPAAFVVAMLGCTSFTWMCWWSIYWVPIKSPATGFARQQRLEVKRTVSVLQELRIQWGCRHANNFFFFLVFLQFELRALLLSGRCSAS
jgi:hypothetical protein